MSADAEGNALRTLQVLRQQCIELHTGMRKISTEALHRALTTPTPACPDLRSGLARIHKKHKALTLRTMRQKQCHRIGLVKPCQVPEITVLAERPLRIRMMRDQCRCRDHRSSSTEFGHEPLATFREKLGIKNRGEISHGRDRAPEKRQDGSQSHRA